jgi:hypothetical protein
MLSEFIGPVHRVCNLPALFLLPLDSSHRRLTPGHGFASYLCHAQVDAEKPSSAAPSEHGDGEADHAEPRGASINTSQAPTINGTVSRRVLVR